ncbi:DUF5808 domain-containing protein [Peptostreptococcus faecalis]|uniref:DUF5808 domain-containing protein n=1 Tax=Peptostreptococcus faecalis TaxID=2045015 RepID=UPI000C79D236|nr:DUF5808 domain-containing protein [Peptostreptococcus faecalis]
MTEKLFLALVINITALFIGVFLIMINEISRSNVVFGVPLNKKLIDSEEVESLKRQYKFQEVIIVLLYMAINTVIIVLIDDLASEDTLAFIYIVLLIAFLIVTFIPFYRMHGKVKAIKQGDIKSGIYENTQIEKTRIDMDLSRRKLQNSSKGWILYIIAFVILIVSIIYNQAIYDSIPNQIPQQMNFEGEVTTYMIKSRLTVVTVQIIGIFMLAIVGFVNYTMLAMKQKNSLNHTKESIENFRKSKSATTIFMGLLSILTILMMVAMDYEMKKLHLGAKSYFTIIIVIYLIAILAISLLFSLKVGSIGDKYNKNIVDYSEEDDKYWHLAGTIYVNKDDPALFVPKRVGYGSSINLGNKKGILCFVGILLLTVVIVVFSIFVSK